MNLDSAGSESSLTCSDTSESQDFLPVCCHFLPILVCSGGKAWLLHSEVASGTRGQIKFTKPKRKKQTNKKKTWKKYQGTKTKQRTWGKEHNTAVSQELCLQHSWGKYSLSNFLSFAAANQEAGRERHEVFSVGSLKGLPGRIKTSTWEPEK